MYGMALAEGGCPGAREGCLAPELEPFTSDWIRTGCNTHNMFGTGFRNSRPVERKS